MNSPKYAADTITEYSFIQKNIIGNYPQNKSRYDLINVIMVCFSKSISKNNNNSNLHRLLNVLFTSELDAYEKKKILETEYNIPITKNLERKMNIMCNLSEAIMEDGIKIGLKQGIESTILLLRKENYTDSKIKLLIMEQFDLIEETADNYLSKTKC